MKTNQIYIQIPITEYDLEYFKHVVYNDIPFTWTFPSENSDHTVHVTFTQEKEEDDV